MASFGDNVMNLTSMAPITAGETTPASTEADNLIDKVRRLPPELVEMIYQEMIYQEMIYQEMIYQEMIYQEMIYSFASTAPGKVVVKVHKGYQPPAEFQINRALRKQFAPIYYRKATLSFCDVDVFEKWLGALAPDTRAMLRSIHYQHDHSLSGSRDGIVGIPRFKIEQRIWQLLVEQGMSSASDVESIGDYVLFTLKER